MILIIITTMLTVVWGAAIAILVEISDSQLLAALALALTPYFWLWIYRRLHV